jgi:hypothetical protein
VKPGLPEFLSLGCAEGTYYDTNVSHLFRGPRLDRDGSIEKLLIDTLAASDSGGVVRGEDFRARVVDACYRTFLDRSPSDTETNHWVRQMGRAASHESVITAFLCSDEYWSRSSRDPGQWLARVRVHLLGQAEAAGVSNDLAVPRAGVSTRPELVADLVRRSECHQHLLETIYGSCLSLTKVARVKPH